MDLCDIDQECHPEPGCTDISWLCPCPLDSALKASVCIFSLSPGISEYSPRDHEMVQAITSIGEILTREEGSSAGRCG